MSVTKITISHYFRKLRYKICHWIPLKKYPNESILKHLPSVCSQAPVGQSAFCSLHTQIVQSMNYPTRLRDFIAHCGGDANSFSKEDRENMQDVLKNISRSYNGGRSTQSGDEAQGITYLVTNRHVADSDNFEHSEEDIEKRCKKDTGDRVRLRKWSRGVLVAVAGSGHILWWCPLYNSEGAGQAAIGMVKFLDLQLAGKTEDDFANFFLSYDNMSGWSKQRN